MNIDRKAPVIADPKHANRVVAEIQTILIDNLAWLNYAFGISEKLITKKNNRRFFYPAIHIGRGEYISLFPNDQLGNYSFFILDSPQEVDYIKNQRNFINSNFSIVFWFNLEKVYIDSTIRNLEEIKADILNVLTGKNFLTEGSMQIGEIYFGLDNVFREYSNDLDLDSQFMMFPFAGIRIKGNLRFLEKC